MRGLAFALSALAVIGLAYWAYLENYRTQTAIREVTMLQRETREARARLSVLRAEWAYLNRPERLRELAILNFDSLELLALEPRQFGSVDEIAYPPRPGTRLNAPIELSAEAQDGDP